MLLNKVVYVVVIILFPSFISSDSGASDCAVPVVIYFGNAGERADVCAKRFYKISRPKGVGDQIQNISENQ